ncbi:tRNA (N(6)-L-threonylcarbamoyladenosine(37)-C(2))-methylthiotransferase MtaB [Chloroflexota bacterium]
MKVALDTLGCKLNQAETEVLARQFVQAGYKLVSLADEADIYILNTCTVTHIADAKSRQLLRRAHRRNPNVLVVATGCYAQRAPQELAQIDGVGLVVDNYEKLHLARLLQESNYLDSLTYMQEDPANNYLPAFKTRTFIKIQDGCNSFCSYCVVPLVRGREKSLPIDQVIAEIKHQVVKDYKEVVLTGTEIGSYNYANISLKGLLKRILSETGVARLRLSSLQPQEISPELIMLWSNRRLCSHFHLPLQSGSDNVLWQMKRRYCVSEYHEVASSIRTLLPNVAITTDIIVGFPGETQEEFEESYNFCRQMEFAQIHVFSYSPRQGTHAAQMLRPVNDKIKKQRSQKMLALARESTQIFNQQFLGKTMIVLWEQRASDGVWSGLTDNYIKVYARSDEDLSNKLLSAKLVGLFHRDGVWGEIVV